MQCADSLNFLVTILQACSFKSGWSESKLNALWHYLNHPLAFFFCGFYIARDSSTAELNTFYIPAITTSVYVLAVFDWVN